MVRQHSQFWAHLLKKGLLLSSILMLAILLTGCQKKIEIVKRLDEKEANEIIVFLAAKGIYSEKEEFEAGGGGGVQTEILWNIIVAKDISTQALAILNANGLPRRRGQDLLGLFKGSGLVPSELEEKIRYQAGLAEQIAHTIRKIDGVLDADVRLSFPEQDPLNPLAEKPQVSASVYVKHQGILDDPNSHLVTKIKRLVSSSIQDLDYDDVTVIGDRARFTDISTMQSQLFKEQKTYVKIWTIIVAKESVTRFRIIFVAFSILVLFTILGSVWVIWKTYPLIMQSGGFQELFNLQPLTLKKTAEPEKEVVEEAVAEEKEEESTAEGEEEETEEEATEKPPEEE